MTDAPETPTPDLRLAYARIIDPGALWDREMGWATPQAMLRRTKALRMADKQIAREALKATHLIGLSQGEGAIPHEESGRG